ncbi:brevican core [Brachionus plicatilis]|uniref:Brevican core n=1 Tax=Brachionus plicatilis TaxID=10195 RepID=A0A3M7PGS5_BRAPC|nr:brevican core [Brachionus plicatilis]
MTKTICLFQCMKNENCSLAIYNKGYCSLHTEFALTRLKNDDLNVVFEKKNINDYCASFPCKKNGTCLSRHDRYECFCSIGYFGSSCNKKISDYNCSSNYFRLDETQSCIPCRSNFNSYYQYPFNCYHFHTSLNFESAKAFCETLNSTLWAPKSYSERSISNTDYSWVNSIISYVGEPFVWPDGSRVHGFEAGEPKNYLGDDYLLYENVLEMQTHPKEKNFLFKKFVCRNPLLKILEVKYLSSSSIPLSKIGLPLIKQSSNMFQEAILVVLSLTILQPELISIIFCAIFHKIYIFNFENSEIINWKKNPLGYKKIRWDSKKIFILTYRKFKMKNSYSLFHNYWEVITLYIIRHFKRDEFT